jgi:hypothetical protein
MDRYIKLCPECRAPTALQAVRCYECAHAYRTYFDPATGQVVSRPHRPFAQCLPAAPVKVTVARVRLALRLMRLAVSYAGPPFLVFEMYYLKDREEAPVLLPLLIIMVIVWLWYLSDDR